MSNEIVHAAIYPAIGVARVGNALQEWFLGPETPEPSPLSPGSYRDSTGALKRQAARIPDLRHQRRRRDRLELTGDGDDVDIALTVELPANTAAAYGFSSRSTFRKQLLHRRPSCETPRSQTVRDWHSAGPRSVEALVRRAQTFDTGSFMGRRVYLARSPPMPPLLDRARRARCGGFVERKLGHHFRQQRSWFDDVPTDPDGDCDAWRDERSKLPGLGRVGPPNYALLRKSGADDGISCATSR